MEEIKLKYRSALEIFAGIKKCNFWNFLSNANFNNANFSWVQVRCTRTEYSHMHAFSSEQAQGLASAPTKFIII